MGFTECLNENPVFGRKVAQMQGAEKFVTGATMGVVRITNFSATQQMGDCSFKHYLNTRSCIMVLACIMA